MHTKLISPFACHLQECIEKYIKIVDNIFLHVVYWSKKNVNTSQGHWLCLSMYGKFYLFSEYGKFCLNPFWLILFAVLRVSDSILLLEEVVLQPDHTWSQMVHI